MSAPARSAGLARGGAWQSTPHCHRLDGHVEEGVEAHAEGEAGQVGIADNVILGVSQHALMSRRQQLIQVVAHQEFYHRVPKRLHALVRELLAAPVAGEGLHGGGGGRQALGGHPWRCQLLQGFHCCQQCPHPPQHLRQSPGGLGDDVRQRVHSAELRGQEHHPGCITECLSHVLLLLICLSICWTILPLGELFISDAVAAREVPRLYEPLGPQTIDAPPLSEVAAEGCAIGSHSSGHVGLHPLSSSRPVEGSALQHFTINSE
mmetsp:Transcript_19326/g.58406  ORF Transcript_19326/g.58406 Transcript_19326/m.58406 type:complete len:263 (-) Transcript_19326:1106-1894(-)